MSRNLDLYATERRATQRAEQVGVLVVIVAMIARDWVLVRLHARRTR